MANSATVEDASRLKGSSPPDLASINDECLSAAEEAAKRVLDCVHPTLDSEEKRSDVIDFVQQVLKNLVNCEVVSYGSVPLKTYLPDGDIDLTVFKGPNVEESLVHDVLAVLHGEEWNENAEFEVKDIRFIDAEVKLVKCLVRDIVVDISFNQLGGISTLCFLEQVDRLVGRNHLFKRSVILVKTWCYYESRIHGAHHGLLSSYALETLILYIFQLFHSSLCGPLSVLYRFLDYYSQFDWENYSISLKGPVYNASFPDLVVKMPESGWKKLLTNDFLEECNEMFTIHSRMLETHPKAFQSKHLNIIDPLKENNNLGRSVHRGNFYRIRSALKYGARKLGQILLLPKDGISDEINKFFANTIARNGSHYSSKLWPSALNLDNEVPLSAMSSPSPVELLSVDDLTQKFSLGNLNNIGNGVEQTFERSLTDISLEMAFEASPHEISNSGRSNHSYITPLYENHWIRPQYYSVMLPAEYRSSEADRVDLACASDNLDTDSTSIGDESEAFNPLADLTGDFDSHIRSLLCGQLCHISASAMSNSPALTRDQNMKPQETAYESMPKARGTGTFFPQMVHYMESPLDWRYLNHELSYHNQLDIYGYNYGIYPAPGELNSFVNVSYEEQWMSSITWNQSPCSIVPHNHGFKISCKTQFGSDGNSTNKVISGSARDKDLSASGNEKTQGSRAALVRQGDARQSAELKIEDEFTPLCLQSGKC